MSDQTTNRLLATAKPLVWVGDKCPRSRNVLEAARRRVICWRQRKDKLL